ncbi:MAG: primary-amine oxidase [Synechococcaceae cyanobacterium SM2_3_1]|nr:primary-amine oxidase [Synechococcaceae cyanobacterium SM2_3_1]
MPGCPPSPDSTTVEHPLDPLTAAEITAAVEIVRTLQQLDSTWRFALVQLQEPPKAVVRAFQPGQIIARRVFMVLYHRPQNQTFEAIIDLNRSEVASWTWIPEVQPVLMFDEIRECDALLLHHPEFLAALARRGITDPSLVMLDYWTVGNYGIPEEKGRRLVRCFCFLRSQPGENGYARPIEGLIPVLDLQTLQMVTLQDQAPVPFPPQPGNYDREYIESFRQDLQPIEISQPQGPSFSIRGHQVEWQNWQFRLSFNAREGLVLHRIGYKDQGHVRSILYRASIAEMVVPYGDPRSPHFRKNAFDIGEYAIGSEANALVLGCDCLGEIHYFDAVMADNQGQPYTLPHAICMHEEDFGVLWKHTDWRSDRAEVRRSRRLVVSFFANISNYDYGFYWYFYQDGTLEFEAKLTGILSVSAVHPQDPCPYGTLVAPQVYAPVHQHFFNARLDMEVDGSENSIYEVHSEAEPWGPHNLYGNAFTTRATLLSREREAQQQVDPLADRYWTIVNPNRLNALGSPVAYKLMPGENTLPLAQPQSSIMQRAGFLKHHLWVTPYDPQENFPAGDYPNQHPGGAGLPTWTQADRSLVNTDLVVWYTFGTTHIPRPEDWPVMPVAYIGFSLKPLGFFDQNPALDVPPSPTNSGCCSHHESTQPLGNPPLQ